MDNLKEFSTITLRNLDKDSNADIIEIMNQVMNDTNIKTGQSVIEYIVRDYAKLKDVLVYTKSSCNQRLKESDKNIRELSDLVRKQRKALDAYIEFQRLMNEID